MSQKPSVAQSPHTVPWVLTADKTRGGSVAIYKVNDIVRVVALPGGIFTLQTGSTQTWEFPGDVEQAAVDGRHEYLIVPGQEVVHSVDDRLRIVNRRTSLIEARIFNANDILRVTLLPGGIVNVGPNQEHFYAFPSDIDRVAVVVGRREIARARRGERVDLTFDPNLHIANDWTNTVTAKLLKENDRLLLVPFATRNVAPGAREAIPIPSDVPRFQVRGIGSTVHASPGDSLVVVNGELMRA